LKRHLGRVADEKIPIHIICKGTYYRDCVLRTKAGIDTVLELIVSGGNWEPGDKVSISYDLDSYTYTFETNVLGSRDFSSGQVSVQADTPERIARLERRRRYRVEPSTSRPVDMYVRTCDGEVATTVVDMGPRGMSFSLPAGSRSFAIGSHIDMNIVLHRLGEAEAQGTVRSCAVLPAVTRYGVEFEQLSDDDAILLEQYTHLRRLEERAEEGLKAASESIFVIVRDSDGVKNFFMCSDWFLGKVEGFASFSEVASVDVIDFLMA
jgi:c-di-GMP-binding flagellar brake protein YcgR